MKVGAARIFPASFPGSLINTTRIECPAAPMSPKTLFNVEERIPISNNFHLPIFIPNTLLTITYPKLKQK